MTVRPVTHKFTVSDYYKMAKAGILNEDDRVELIEGEIVEMAPIGSRHALCVDILNGIFNRRIDDDRGWVRIQNPIHLDEHSEPQPDIVIARSPGTNYGERHPGPPDVLLLVEVADSSLISDRMLKVPLYARAGIAEVWLVDLTQSRIEVNRKPSEGAFAEQQTFSRGQSVSPLAFLDIVISVDQIVG